MNNLENVHAALQHLYEVAADTHCFTNVYVTNIDDCGEAYYRIEFNDKTYIGKVGKRDNQFIFEGELPHA